MTTYREASLAHQLILFPILESGLQRSDAVPTNSFGSVDTPVVVPRGQKEVLHLLS
jgi:hypothetical protein